ncbi:Pentatricopeptide repeat-containing protein At2g15820, chloroplastic [Linum grandiflorum]
MNVGSIAPDISLFKSLFQSHNPPPLLPNHNPPVNLYSDHTMRLSLLSPLSFLTVADTSSRRRILLLRSPSSPAKTARRAFRPFRAVNSFSHSVEHLACDSDNLDSDEFKFEGDGDGSGRDMRHLGSPGVEVKELEELPEQWRRARLAWLCKELPAHKSGTLVRILNAQRKWMRQDDVTYLIVHCTRIRENEVAFKVYKWMMQQRWYRFDFALSTKLADFLGKERKFTRCREVYDDILNQGRVPSESTFHILVVSYLSAASVEATLDEACTIFNQMIQLGGYNPLLSLHNSLFRALVAKPRARAKYLKQAEFIYHNLVSTGLEVQKDIYGGLIWLHSYQDVVDKERIMQLREEMVKAGIEESKDVVLSVLRASSKEGDVEEAEKAWATLKGIKVSIPSMAFVYRMETFKEMPMKAMEIFREMREPTISGYQKIIEVMCKAREVEIAESLMAELVGSGLKPLAPSYAELATLYLKLGWDHHDKVGSVFESCMEKCRPDRGLYNLYLDSLVKVGDLAKAEEVFEIMRSTESIGVDSVTCNTILSGYLESGDHVKAEKVYYLMCKKRYIVESSSIDKLEYVLENRKKIKKPAKLKLSAEQREALVGLLLGGLKIESDQLLFELNENSTQHSVLRHHLYDEYHEWLHPPCRLTDHEDTPYSFTTISHSHFEFYADQFWPGGGRFAIPKLIHRWLSPRALAYWYMIGGSQVMPSGVIVLKVKGDEEGVARVVKALRGKSLECRVKRKGRVFWIGFVGRSCELFWNIVEPYVLDGLQECLRAGGSNGSDVGGEDVGFDGESGDDEVGDGDGLDRGHG